MSVELVDNSALTEINQNYSGISSYWGPTMV